MAQHVEYGRGASEREHDLALLERGQRDEREAPATVVALVVVVVFSGGSASGGSRST